MKMKNNIKTYSELISLKTFEERFEYLKLNGSVGKDTFGYDRYINQIFYNSKGWKRIKDSIIVRDNGCDLGLSGYDIYGRIYLHHINPLEKLDIINATEYLTNPEYLICTSFNTHNAIHYGNSNNITSTVIERSKNDTCPWK